MISDKDENNGWQEWRHHIIAELKRLNGNVEKIEEKTSGYMLNVSVEIGRLKVWSAIYGAIAGMVATLLVREVLNRL